MCVSNVQMKPVELVERERVDRTLDVRHSIVLARHVKIKTTMCESWGVIDIDRCKIGVDPSLGMSIKQLRERIQSVRESDSCSGRDDRLPATGHMQ